MTSLLSFAASYYVCTVKYLCVNVVDGTEGFGGERKGTCRAAGKDAGISTKGS